MNKNEKFREIANGLADLYEQKNTAYGDSFGRSIKKYGKIAALTRISDKFNRLETLMLNDNINCGDEKIEDTLRDMASYAIMTVLELYNNDEDDVPEHQVIYTARRISKTKSKEENKTSDKEPFQVFYKGKKISMEEIPLDEKNNEVKEIK